MSDLLAKMKANAGLVEEPIDEFQAALAQYADFVPVIGVLDSGERPGDWFNARHSCSDVLANNGFVQKIEDGRQTRWVHTSSKNGDPNISVFKDNNTCTVFGTRVPGLETNRTYDPFGLFVALEHNGDFAEAATSLRDEMGHNALPQPPEPPKTALQVPEATQIEQSQQIAPVLSIVPPARALDEYPTLDWKSIVPRGTFLWRWMELTEGTELKPEFMFWLGLTALGLAVGDSVLLQDRWPVRGNLFVCLVSKTGAGKSQTTGLLELLMLEAFPYDKDDFEAGVGVNLISGSGSGEAIVDEFIRSVTDELGKETPVGVKGLIEFNELARFVGIRSRAGSTVETFLQEFYDGYKPVKQSTRTHGKLQAVNHFASAITTTQPEAVSSLLSRGDMYSGFLNRWIYGMGPDKTRQAIDETRYNVSALVGTIREVRNAYYGGDTTWFRWEKDAAAVWTPFHDTVLETRRVTSPDFLSKRCDLTLKKIALLLAVNQHDQVFTADVVERSIATYDYLLKSYAILESKIGVDDFTMCCDAVKDAIRAHEARTGQPMPKREITNSVPSWFSRKTIREALDNVTAMGDIAALKPANGSGEFYKVA